MAVVNDFDLFVGGQSGTFKGISIDLKDKSKKPITKNIQNLKALTKEHEITALNWGDSEENEVLVGMSGQKVRIYDTEFKAFTNNIDVKCGTGSIKGISRYKEHLLTAIESGEVKIWSHSEEEDVINTGKKIEKMKHSPFNSAIIATGGKENDLKLWDLEKKVSTFEAKNVRPDMLELRVPIWISDMDFMPNTSKVAVCTRYGHVRLYDASTSQRRPVINFDIPEQSLTSMSVAHRDHQVLVGSGKGKLILMDLRSKGEVVQYYKGAAGSVKAIACHKTEPYIVSAGLDRHLLVHNFHSKALIRKIYLKSRLNCILLKSDAFLKIMKKECENVEGSDDDVQIVENDYDELFDNMETIEEQPPKKKQKVNK